MSAPPRTTVPFGDITACNIPLLDELDAVWRRVTRSGRFIGGEVVEEFEDLWAELCAAAHCVGVGNGTDALELALRAVGVGPGVEVVVPANTFAATAEAVVAVGAEPVFVDVDPETLLMTPETVAPALDSRTAAVIAVHLYGQAVDVPALRSLVAGTGVALVEDCAQAHGAAWHGRPVGGLGDVGCFSFYPGKNLGAFGDGGAVVTSEAVIADAVRQLADHGRSAADRNAHDVPGRNSRLDALQAGVLTVKSRHLGEWNAQRRRIHDWYLDHLEGLPSVGTVLQRPESTSVHHLEVVLVDGREDVRLSMRAEGVETSVHYPRLCVDQPAFAGYRSTPLPVARAAVSRQLSLPMHTGLQEPDVIRVAGALSRGVLS